ncbi:hypothetical protein [Methylocystis iwaonis]|uniref:Uncharacterized protein n=1 Tax=Methylocystis iwaonis TaxID=2885079 RepID=A0ABN6VGV2_9HYPH|nr:hypothetical protein [Methylocystis iwaonis]BDV34896.1 hypothetical protein SS37A_24250 [Methylocystis iwaonis]
MREEQTQLSFNFSASIDAEKQVRQSEQVRAPSAGHGDDLDGSADIVCLEKHRAKKLSNERSNYFDAILKLASHIG